jgi:hypothetical protein
MTLTDQMTNLAKQAKAASRELARLTTLEKNACLLAMADTLERSGSSIKEANATDLEAGEKAGLSTAMLDRLKLDDKRIAGMAKGLREVAALPDPVGKVLRGGHHLRVTPQRHSRRCQSLFQIRQCHHPAWRQRSYQLEPNYCQGHDHGREAGALFISSACDSARSDSRSRGD